MNDVRRLKGGMDLHNNQGAVLAEIYKIMDSDGMHKEFVCDGTYHVEVVDVSGQGLDDFYGRDAGCTVLCGEVAIGQVLPLESDEVFLKEDQKVIRRNKPCDGSCKDRRKDVAAAITALPRELQLADGRTVVDSLHLDQATAKLLSGPGPLHGRVFYTSYAKRQGETTRLCTGSHHVEIETDHEWVHRSDREDRHEVRTTQCDGSCRSRLS